MKTIEIIVKCCKECPFSSCEKIQEGYWSYNCFAPVQIHKHMYNMETYYNDETSPYWCPLKNKQLIIKQE